MNWEMISAITGILAFIVAIFSCHKTQEKIRNQKQYISYNYNEIINIILSDIFLDFLIFCYYNVTTRFEKQSNKNEVIK